MLTQERFIAHILPTEKDSHITLDNGNNHHVYIVSYTLNNFTLLNLPKKGDWVYNFLRKNIYQLTTSPVSYELKIIASTDKEITPCSWLPILYVDNFIISYNKNGDYYNPVVLELLNDGQVKTFENGSVIII